MGFKLIILCVFALLIQDQVQAGVEDHEAYFRIGQFELKELDTEQISDKNFGDRIDNLGRIIGNIADLVALGEEIYTLVDKGRPTNSTVYIPISVIPKVSGQPVDLLDTENWPRPTKKTYEITYKNPFGAEVVKFRYSLFYTVGGTYDGKGAYITALQIIPESVRTLYGWEFFATMRIGSIQNVGTRANPVAGITIMLEYHVTTMVEARQGVKTFFLTGKGVLKKY